MTPKLYKATEVCDLAQVQPYVLRSWEKEFPGIGVSSAPDGPRLYRESDLEQVRRIRQLVFGEGLTVAGARRRLDDTSGVTEQARTIPSVSVSVAAPVAEPTDVVAPDVRVRMQAVRDGLRSLLLLLGPGQADAAGQTERADRSTEAMDYQLTPPVVEAAPEAPPVSRSKKTPAGPREAGSAPKRRRVSA